MSKRAGPLLIELAGIMAITAGIWLIYPPAALIVGGAGAVLWAQGVAR